MDPNWKSIIAAHLTYNYKEHPLGVNSEAPGLGWQLKCSGNNRVQLAYRIIVPKNPDELENGNGTVWDSGKIKSPQSINIRYKGKKSFILGNVTFGK